MISIKIINASHIVKKKHGEILLSQLKGFSELHKGEDLYIKTNIRFRNEVPELHAFNSVLQQYQQQGNSYILIKLKK